MVAAACDICNPRGITGALLASEGNRVSNGEEEGLGHRNSHSLAEIQQRKLLLHTTSRKEPCASPAIQEVLNTIREAWAEPKSLFERWQQRATNSLVSLNGDVTAPKPARLTFASLSMHLYGTPHGAETLFRVKTFSRLHQCALLPARMKSSLIDVTYVTLPHEVYRCIGFDGALSRLIIPASFWASAKIPGDVLISAISNCANIYARSAL
ncbi:hypothetical protein EVAR_3948_1 [Eumeta japonica]|uniref:Uncharacterized protein n=1 Tax=Eumeta variegata TaxID=151549 RepID=A0A4C1SRJ0_EUMVA|nr:hypothetical protein EVAR_3948_1 [Eumeta japonica]